ncbi:MAG TPA: choice-of-anchor tandem repeat GloVer-containing protein, partial [Bryobacteraceae bacterium]|nr:choice-of-anchor tandem repeat GloVer-containing protein [Bryobacteraceae bacterium]
AVAGSTPVGGVSRDPAGNLYGTTFGGGPAGVGVVYKLDPSGREKVLYGFTGGSDGQYPESGVVGDSAGNLYGTTYGGGASGSGLVYKLDSAGHQTVLHSFTNNPDGALPNGKLIRDAAGNLYGTTFVGGWGVGTVYRLDAAGQETVLYNFTGGADGSGPIAGVVRDAAGNLYGTTFYGGAYGKGVVYELDTSGHETVLYSFAGWTDGNGPSAGVVLDAAGNLYGTTQNGGMWGEGVVYKLDTNGLETVLYSFTGGADGGYPSGLFRDPAGNLYGTTSQGGIGNYGVVYKLDTAGHQTVLYTFTGGTDGRSPDAGLIADPAGNLYGTAGYGGAKSSGVVFKIAP